MRVVNVCFHGIGSPQRALEPGEEAYWTTPDTFLGVLDRVADRDDVRLSFDDGNESDIRIALPALQERGLTAAFFVVAGRLDQHGSLSRDDVRELHAAGMTIGNHGMTHRPWRGLDVARQQEELVTSRAVLAQVVGRPVLDAACPLGRYDRTVLSALRRAGYRSVHTSDRRWARSERWLQPRYSLHHDDTPESFERGVLGRPRVAAQAKGALVGTVKRLR
ncbi:Polysaccharide deacetylase [Nocardioides exalbidus]|uniref:Polysaccharide deacetylase n=1 Tax=Nocardioides exalbidus TaxID=402596 RepID=A0A1H4KD84_9ACTN|nr:polysaccharide deacetylase family protein [Nocardioides exalbidus]SEB56353.1 Polysaccharide deacetylase [Nocardioides exalbidus]